MLFFFFFLFDLTVEVENEILVPGFVVLCSSSVKMCGLQVQEQTTK